jgi:hypothetical protein
LIGNFVLREYFSERGRKKFNSTVNKLEGLRGHRFLETAPQKECLDALIKLARQTDDLRSWRDNDLHKFSQTVFGVLENPETDDTLGTLWTTVLEEHNRVREALMAAIGMIVLGRLVSSTYYKAAWPMPTRHIDFKNPDDIAMHRQLLRAIRRTVSLKNDIRRAESHDVGGHRLQIVTEAMEIDRLVRELYGMPGTKEERAEDHLELLEMRGEAVGLQELAEGQDAGGAEEE